MKISRFTISTGLKAGLEGKEYYKCVTDCRSGAIDGYKYMDCENECENTDTWPTQLSIPEPDNPGDIWELH